MFDNEKLKYYDRVHVIAPVEEDDTYPFNEIYVHAYDAYEVAENEYQLSMWPIEVWKLGKN
jgi:hypothetical protein